MSNRWDLRELADRLGETLQGAEDAFRLEQAVYGLDSLDEVRLHQLMVRGLSRWYTVLREAYYPSSASGGGVRKRSGRPRCDLVITPHGRPLRTSDEPDLFTPADAVPPEEALWVEVKSAYQFKDVATTDSNYAGQWRQGVVDDLKKMLADSRIHEAAMLLVVFNESEEVLAKDLELFQDHLSSQKVLGPMVTQVSLSSARHVRSVRITDRMGHRLASVAVWPTMVR
jgi:hypothetical protein